ncbi:adhesive plaque matrix protein isoform X10 [Agrilus planipennis]|uniref:Adhesive plaque matrix protein isoform X10 n=1 Tax=Agrilus planipennis TaxID=224129 RepID=A0A7F5RIM8_AGRPL|nr:adhesive plaque matrix protein isoform X10 [Agrilus planipennis]
MVYESDFYTTRRPYRTSPSLSTYTVSTYLPSRQVRILPGLGKVHVVHTYDRIVPYVGHKRLTVVSTPPLTFRVRPSVIYRELDRIANKVRPWTSISPTSHYLNSESAVKLIYIRNPYTGIDRVTLHRPTIIRYRYYPSYNYSSYYYPLSYSRYFSPYLNYWYYSPTYFPRWYYPKCLLDDYVPSRITYSPSIYTGVNTYSVVSPSYIRRYPLYYPYYYSSYFSTFFPKWYYPRYLLDDDLFDDETRYIRAQAASVLRRIHSPVPRTPRALLPPVTYVTRYTEPTYYSPSRALTSDYYIHRMLTTSPYNAKTQYTTYYTEPVRKYIGKGMPQKFIRLTCGLSSDRKAKCQEIDIPPH